METHAKVMPLDRVNGFMETPAKALSNGRDPHESCNGRDHSWWMKTILYQIYPRSFQDSTGNGVGDLQGIISRLDHLTSIGVGAIWLSPFYPSPQYDFGYDISDFCDVDPMYGTLEDFNQLIKACQERDIKLLMDFVPGHTSHLHKWFQKSVKREEPYTDYYVWHDGVVGEDGHRRPPNNWLSIFGGTAWTWNEERGQFYYRPFLAEQPKLNYRNPHVVEDMKNVLRFWLDRGVAGMRVDALAEVWEAEDKLLNEPKNPYATCPDDQCEYLDRIHTSMLPEGFHLVRGWKDVLDEYEKQDGISRFMVIEVYNPAPERNVYRKYGGVPFNMNLVDRLAADGLSGENIYRLVREEYDHLSPEEWPTFVLGNHDRPRVSAKYGREYCDALNMLVLTLKGTPTTYYGEELGMDDLEIPFEKIQDPWGIRMGIDRYKAYCRDPERTPMQWDNTPQAGFTTSDKPWLPVHPNVGFINAKSQMEGSQQTHLKVYQALAKLRQEPAFLYGDLVYGITTQDVFSFVRHDTVTGQRYLIVLNFGKNESTNDFTTLPDSEQEGLVMVATSTVHQTLAAGQRIDLKGLTLKPGDGVVIQLTSGN